MKRIPMLVTLPVVPTTHSIAAWAKRTRLTLLGLGLFALILAAFLPAAAGAAPTYVRYDLGTFGGSAISAQKINNAGQVVGYAAGAVYRAVLWTPTSPNGTTGSMVDLGTLGGNAFAMGINDMGQVVGYSTTAGGSNHAFLWTPGSPNGTSGSMVDLGTFGGNLPKST